MHGNAARLCSANFAVQTFSDKGRVNGSSTKEVGYELKSQTPRAVGWFLAKQAEISYNARSGRAQPRRVRNARNAPSKRPTACRLQTRAIVPRSVRRSCSIKLGYSRMNPFRHSASAAAHVRSRWRTVAIV